MMTLDGADEVLLCILCICSLMGTLHVELTIKMSKFQTPASLLVMYVNNGLSCCIISTFPYVFQDVNNGCLYSSVLFFYGYFQMLLVCCLCLKFTNHSLLMRAIHNIKKASDFSLGWQTKVGIGVLPMLPNILVITTNPSESLFDVWCTVPFNNLNGYYIHIQFFVITAILYVFIGCELYSISVLCSRRNSRENLVHFQENILFEPAVYAAVTLVGIIFSTLIVFMDYDQSNYVLRYAQTVLIYFLGKMCACVCVVLV